jgi:hypothetical protein
MGYGAAIAGVIGAGASIYGGMQKDKAAKKAAKAGQGAVGATAEERAQISKEVAAEAQFARRQTQSAETARGLVMGQLGREGTYGPTSAGQGQFSVDLGRPSGLSGLWAPGAQAGLYGDTSITGVSDKATYNRKSLNRRDIQGEFNVEGYVADPYETAANITNTAQFGTVSAMVAQANQLANREGELWDTLNNSVIGGVFEGAARQQREMMGQLSKAAARGGGSARAGLRIAQQFAVQESVNRERTTALWSAKLKLEEHVNKTVQSNINFATGWVNNQAGIRDTFVNTMNEMRTFWSRVIPSIAMPAGTAAAGQLIGIADQQSAAQIAAINDQTKAINAAVTGVAGAVTSSLADDTPKVEA